MSEKKDINLDAMCIDMLKEVVRSHDVLAQEHNATVLLKHECNECYLDSDVYRVKQVFANIISNAIKYSNGIVHIKVNCTKDMYMINIDDNGPGIQDKSKAFELFEQVDNDSSTKHNKGTGVGLNFVKHLCEGLGIEYKAEDSKELGGLSFKLFIKSKKE